MTKDAFKSETKSIRERAQSRLRRLNADIEEKGGAATPDEEATRKLYQRLVDQADRFDKKNDGSSEPLEDILRRQAAAAYAKACEAQKALKQLVELAKKNGGDPVVDRAFGDPDGHGGFKPLSAETYDEIAQKLAKPPPAFEDVYFGYRVGQPLTEGSLKTTAETAEHYQDIHSNVFHDANKKPLKKLLVELGPAFIGATPERQALTFMHEYIGHIVAGAEDNEDKLKDVKCIRYYDAELETPERVNAFFAQRGALKRECLGAAWAAAAYEAAAALSKAGGASGKIWELLTTCRMIEAYIGATVVQSHVDRSLPDIVESCGISSTGAKTASGYLAFIPFPPGSGPQLQWQERKFTFAFDERFRPADADFVRWIASGEMDIAGKTISSMEVRCEFHTEMAAGTTYGFKLTNVPLVRKSGSPSALLSFEVVGADAERHVADVVGHYRKFRTAAPGGLESETEFQSIKWNVPPHRSFVQVLFFCDFDERRRKFLTEE